MPDETSLPIPQEIPWKLVTTTQRLKADGQKADDVTLSLFSFEPSLEALEENYPDERVIYFKITASVAPCPLEPPSILAPDFANQIKQLMMESGLPVIHLILDLKVTPKPMSTGRFRPYFHEAAPIRREMIESGVVGGESVEGETQGTSVGKSGSQLYETVSSQIKSKSSGGGWFPSGVLGGPGFTAHSSKTHVDSERHVDQTTEMTSRDASQERRELLSHTTHVHNVLTLLNSKHIGSPYLRFSLWPRPLHLLAVDPADPDLWYQQLLARRSSGIEGIQEFVFVVVAPRNKNFCLEGRMRRFCVLDRPPTFEIPKGDALSLDDEIDIQHYLYEIFPAGTPVEELDVDLNDQLKISMDKTAFRPAIEGWFVDSYVAYLIFQAPHGGLDFMLHDFPIPDVGYLAYKSALEVFLEMKRARYEEALARSPLERGKLMMHSLTLKSCFTFAQERLTVDGEGTAKHGPPEAVAHAFTPPPPFPAPDETAPASRKSRSTALRWNAVARSLADHLTVLPDDAGTALRLDDARMMEILLDFWASLSPGHALNLTLAKAVSLLGLTERQQRLLDKAGVSDLRGIARAIQVAPLAQELELRRQRFLSRRGERKQCLTAPKPIAHAISAQEAADLRKTIGRTLARASSGGN